MVKTDYIEIAAIRDECAQQLLIDLVFVLLCFFSLPFFFVVVCPYFAWDNRITDVRPVFTAGEDYHHPSVSAALCCAWIIIRL